MNRPELKDVLSFSKEYGFIYGSSEIYEGLQAVYDYGPIGVMLKRKLQDLWWKTMTRMHEKIVGLDSSILMNPKVWKASGHVDSFHDLMVDNKDSKKRYRVDVLIEDYADALIAMDKENEGKELLDLLNKYIAEEDYDSLGKLISDYKIICPISKTSNWTPVRQFNLMFETNTGASQDSSQKLYLRPETAQGIFVNYLNVQKTQGMSIPFGIAQIGKAFRNEIVARQFIFRMREFEQMEMQFFVQPGSEKEWYQYWKQSRRKWYAALGIADEHITFHDHDNLAHYASEAVDIQFEFPFGRKEIEGIHSRTDFDLKSHEQFSKKKLRYFDPKTNESYIPYVIETSVGSDRIFLMLLCNYLRKEKSIKNDREVERTYFAIIPPLAPYSAAILPLTKKDGLPQIAKKIYDRLKFLVDTKYDENQSIGKRYAKQDIIGTPFCLTVDHQTAEDHTVTLRHRDSMMQERITVEEAIDKILHETSINKILNA